MGLPCSCLNESTIGFFSHDFPHHYFFKECRFFVTNWSMTFTDFWKLLLNNQKFLSTSFTIKNASGHHFWLPKILFNFIFSSEKFFLTSVLLAENSSEHHFWLQKKSFYFIFCWKKLFSTSFTVAKNCSQLHSQRPKILLNIIFTCRKFSLRSFLVTENLPQFHFSNQRRSWFLIQITG